MEKEEIKVSLDNSIKTYKGSVKAFEPYLEALEKLQIQSDSDKTNSKIKIENLET